MGNAFEPYPALLLIPMVLAMPIIVAHVPLFGEGGGSLDDALPVDDPTKSWVIYTSHEGSDQVDYYRLSLKEGDTLLVGIIVPASEGRRGFSPDMVVMGPGLGENGTFPPTVQRASGGYLALASETPSHLVYEPFSPGTFYELASIEMSAPADGDYYVAVYDGSNGGDYGLVVGKRESFTLGEWLTIPFSLMTVYRWEGQQWWTILAPGVGAFIVGMAVSASALRGSRRRPDARWLLLSIAGSLMIASGAIFGYQTASKLWQVGGLEPAAALSVAFALIPLLLGAAALKVAHRSLDGRVTSRFRVALLVIAALALMSWSGWVIGPAMVAMAAFLPSSLSKRL